MGTIEYPNQNHNGQLRDTPFGRGVVAVLRHLHDPVYLQAHVLTRYTAGRGSGPSGESLKRAVASAIEELRQASSLNKTIARGYNVLHLYYIQGLSRDEVQRRLLISRSEFHRALARSQESLVGLLAQRWGAEIYPRGESESGVASGALIPTPIDSFIGRATELAEVQQLLLDEPAARLVTIQGPPGAGKTRLAIELARRLDATFRGDVFYVPLATLSNADAVPDAIVAALGLAESSVVSAQECLENFFRPRESLLVLDNLEHLSRAARVVASLLAAAPHLKVLATSRSVLRISGERRYPLSPLAVPHPEISGQPAGNLLQRMSDFESVQLFVERARAANPAFLLTTRNAHAVCSICQQVDGLPLAIELVAARTRTLSTHAILERLKHRLDLAAGRDVDRPTRQRNLRTAISWSYDLLGQSERQLFRLFGIFEGPCSLEAVEAMAGSNRLLDTLDELVAQSIVRRWDDEEGNPYFDMLGTIRELAVEQLRASGEFATVEERFLAYYRALAEKSTGGLRGPHQIAWANRLAIESPNLTSAVNRLLKRDPDRIFGFVAALVSYWMYRSQLSIGREWSERVLRLSGADPLGAAYVRFNAAVIARDQGDIDVAQRYAETSLREFQALHEARGSGRCLNLLGLLALQRGDYALAQQQVTASHAIFERINNQLGVGWSYYALGAIYEQQRSLWRARAVYERAHAILSELGDIRGIALALSGLGNVQRLLGEFDRSKENLEEALRLQYRIGNRSGAELTLLALSGLAHHAGDFAVAHRLISESIDIATQIGDRRNLRTAHAFRIVVLKSEGRFTEALDIAEQVLAMCREQSDVQWIALLLATIGDLVERVGSGEATDFFRQSLQILSVFNDRWATARTIVLVGLWAARHRRFQDAMRALGAAEAIQQGIRTTIDYSHSVEWTTVEARAREELGALDAAAALDRGKSMSVGRALAFARCVLDRATPLSGPSVRDNPYSAETRLG